jgi:hypothetical protein
MKAEVKHRDVHLKRKLQARSLALGILALVLLPGLLYVLRVPIGFGLFLIVNPLCPCIASACPNCACNACVYRVIGGILAFLIVVPLLFYFLVHRRRRVT